MCGVTRGTEEPSGTHRYRSYGLTIEVPFECTNMAPADAASPADVTVSEGPVDTHLPAAVVSESMCDVAPGVYLHRGGPRSGRYLARGGNEVVVERHAEAEERILADQLVVAALPAILRQRGRLVLHANGVVIDGGAVLIAGESGAGKSTTLAALLERDCQMLSDDVAALQLDDDARIVVPPGPANIRLIPDSVAGVVTDRMELLRSKVVLETEHTMASRPVPLRAVYVLRPDAQNTVRTAEIAGAEKFEALLGCIYGPLLQDEHPGVFPLLAAVLKQVPVLELRRPEHRSSIDEVTDRILQTPIGAR